MGCLTLKDDSVELLDSKVPSKIWINKDKLIIGRGSPKLSVDVIIGKTIRTLYRDSMLR